MAAKVWAHLGWRDLRTRYASTFLGPWWSVANLLATVVGSAFAVSLLSGETTLSAVPRIAITLTLWTFIAASLSEATTSLDDAKSLLLNSSQDELSTTLRLIWRNWLILVHNLLVVVVVFALFERESILFVALLIPVSVLLALLLVLPVVLVARLVYWKPAFRAIIPPATQFLFFLTPVIWKIPESGPGVLLLQLNPAAWVLHVAEQLIQYGELEIGYVARLVALLTLGLLATKVFLNNVVSVKKYL